MHLSFSGTPWTVLDHHLHQTPGRVNKGVASILSRWKGSRINHRVQLNPKVSTAQSRSMNKTQRALTPTSIDGKSDSRVAAIVITCSFVRKREPLPWKKLGTWFSLPGVFSPLCCPPLLSSNWKTKSWDVPGIVGMKKGAASGFSGGLIGLFLALITSKFAKLCHWVLGSIERVTKPGVKGSGVILIVLSKSTFILVSGAACNTVYWHTENQQSINSSRASNSSTIQHSKGRTGAAIDYQFCRRSSCWMIFAW